MAIFYTDSTICSREFVDMVYYGLQKIGPILGQVPITTVQVLIPWVNSQFNSPAITFLLDLRHTDSKYHVLLTRQDVCFVYLENQNTRTQTYIKVQHGQADPSKVWPGWK
jgi:hypothetical protein